MLFFFFFFSSRRRHTRLVSDWSSDVCSSDLLVRFDAQWLIQGHGSCIINCDLRGQSDNLPQLVYLSHRLVKNRCNDSAVRMAWRPGVALTQTKMADEPIAPFVKDKLQPHSIRIAHSASEAKILLQANVAGVVSATGETLSHFWI